MNCETCQLLLYDLLDRKLSLSQGEDVGVHMRSCRECLSFMEAEVTRMKRWPKLFDEMIYGGRMPPDALDRFFRNLDKHRRNSAESGQSGVCDLSLIAFVSIPLAAALFAIAGLQILCSTYGTDAVMPFCLALSAGYVPT